MRDEVKRWLAAMPEPKDAKNAPFICVRLPDRTVLSRQPSQQFSAPALEGSLRCVADTFQVLALHRSTAQSLCFVYEKTKVFGVVRPDGACLGVFASADAANFDFAALSKLAVEFQSLGHKR